MYINRLKQWPTEPRKMPNAHSQNAYTPPQPPTTERSPVGVKKGNWLDDAMGYSLKIVQTVFIFIVILWIVGNGTLIATDQPLSGIRFPLRVEGHFNFVVFFFLTLQALLFSSSPLLSVNVCSSKAYSYPLCPLFCVKMGHLYNCVFHSR
ncbi:hypothetical protein ILYODFUR_006356 [Ilyodon furcidens]|uniref:Uncharacterized protein n=1 Tax=Ilyodon furcidens TaxID=33524 RepID=A0ABV0SUX0_9TELE